MSDLRYRAGVRPEDLQVGECCVRPFVAGEAREWHLVLCYANRTTGERGVLSVPVNVRGGPITVEGEPWWGLADVGGDVWQVSPSIDAGNQRYHETPRIIGVPADEPWVLGHAP